MKKIQRKSKQEGDKTSDKDSSKDDKGNISNGSLSFSQFVYVHCVSVLWIFCFHLQIIWAIRMTAFAVRTFRWTVVILII